MRDDEWDTWAQWHASVFGLTTETDGLMIAAWRDVFEACGYSGPELREASQYLAATRPPRWRSDHLPALHGRIRAVRWKRFEDEQAQLDREQSTATPCSLCSGSGAAAVPHLGFVAGGVWLPPQREWVVACKCAAGQRRLNAFLGIDSAEVERKRIKRPMTLLDYERKNPFWQEQVAQKAELRRAEVNARNLANAGDRRHGPLTEDEAKEIFKEVPRVKPSKAPPRNWRR